MYRDFRAYYGLDFNETLRAVLDGDLNPGDMLALCEGIPPGSMCGAILQDEDYWPLHLGTTRETYLLGAVVDSVNQNTAATAMTKKPIKFKPIPTPADEVKAIRDKQKLREGGLRALRERMAARHGTGA